MYGNRNNISNSNFRVNNIHNHVNLHVNMEVDN
jgi:hypothetical protein